MNWLVILAQTAAALLGALGIGQIIQAVARRKTVRAEAADILTESALEWAQQLKADARADVTEARKEAAEARQQTADARREVDQLHRQIRLIKAETEQVAGYLAQVIRWIQSSDMSMDRLRGLVGQSGPLNGLRQ